MPGHDRPDDLEPEHKVSRRSLLAGTAGLSVGAIAAGSASAQDAGKSMQLAAHGGAHGSRSGSLSQRAYSVPTAVANDIAHDPAAVPPPITRKEPATVQVDLETIEMEARLDHRATF